MPTPTTDLAAALTETLAAYRAAMAAGDTLRAAHMESRANAILETMQANCERLRKLEAKLEAKLARHGVSAGGAR